MKKLKGFQLVLLLVVPLFWVCDPQTQIDRSIDMASDYNVLVSFRRGFNLNPIPYSYPLQVVFLRS